MEDVRCSHSSVILGLAAELHQLAYALISYLMSSDYDQSQSWVFQYFRSAGIALVFPTPQSAFAHGHLDLCQPPDFIQHLSTQSRMPVSERKRQSSKRPTISVANEQQREKKRLQNRISQQYFREKQTIYIQHLEQFVNSIEKCDEF
jgi:hypothetical protein